MVEFVFDFTVVGIFLTIVTAGLIGAKMWRNNSHYDAKTYESRHKLQEKYIKELEFDNDAYNEEVKSLKASLSRKDRAPSIKEEDMGDWSKLIPDLFGDISGFLPKKLQPLFENKDLQGALINKVLENPEKFKPYIEKFISKTIGKEKLTVASEGL